MGSSHERWRLLPSGHADPAAQPDVPGTRLESSPGVTAERGAMSGCRLAGTHASASAAWRGYVGPRIVSTAKLTDRALAGPPTKGGGRGVALFHRCQGRARPERASFRNAPACTGDSRSALWARRKRAADEDSKIIQGAWRHSAAATGAAVPAMPADRPGSSRTFTCAADSDMPWP